jgi:hypothetical protein
MSESVPAELNDLYSKLETLTPETILQGTAGGMFQVLRDELKKQGEEKWAKVAHVELCAFSYHVHSGELRPMFGFANG